MDIRLNIRRLLTSLFCTFVLPLSVAILADIQLDWFPLVTIAASIIFIPLSTVVVVRVALSEMDQMIRELTPFDSDVHKI